MSHLATLRRASTRPVATITQFEVTPPATAQGGVVVEES